MSLERLSPTYLSAIEEELRQVIGKTWRENLDPMWLMLTYHMGWEGEGAGSEARGKRIRPLLVLLASHAAGGEWQSALPAAAAAELVHNFSLIHDDIQDHSPLRRGRLAVWKRWGVAQAINAGDAMFTLAQIAVLRLVETVAPDVALAASSLLNQTCLLLTQGQYLDMSYEARDDLTLDDYWPMVDGKTAALLSACLGLGALVAEAEPPIFEAYRRFGHSLGLAFQVQDDLLGIWGEPVFTGKSAKSDLISGKKTLPVLYGLTKSREFASRWKLGGVTADEVSSLASMLESEGARAYTQEWANTLTEDALQALDDANAHGEAGIALHQLANRLLSRQA